MNIDMEKIENLDAHWTSVLKLAERYGFIVQAAGGTAVLLTHKNQIEANGEEEYLSRQKALFGDNMPDATKDDFVWPPSEEQIAEWTEEINVLHAREDLEAVIKELAVICNEYESRKIDHLQTACYKKAFRYLIEYWRKSHV